VTKRYAIFMVFAAGVFISNIATAKVTGLPDFTDLVAETAPAVVNIRVTQFGERVRPVPDGQGNRQPNQEDIPELFRRFFDIPGNPGGAQPDRRGSGSGFIIESDGYIITNHHVINEADQILVRMGDRREFQAELVGSDPQSDIALLKIDAENLPTLQFGNSNDLEAGEWVVAIGSPFNFDQTVTAGIVSAKGRSNNAQQYVPFIQSDVAINQGNSGGPLLNMDGEVVGINSWILSSSGGYIGLSFSIPVEIAAQSVEQLREHGKVSRGLLGVVVGAVTREMAEAMNLERPTGALVNNVNDGSSADRAGIEPGDIILEFQGQVVEQWSDLPPMVGLNPPGTEVSLLVSRNGEMENFTAVLDSLETDAEGNLQASTSTDSPVNALGLAVESISPDQRRAIGDAEGGVVISRVENDAAYRAGLRRGDVILMIGSKKVEDIESFEEIVEDLPEGKAVALRILRNGVSNFIAYTPSVE
jgi:serine protease Do